MSRQKVHTSPEYLFLRRRKHETNIVARPCKCIFGPLHWLRLLTNESTGTVLDSDQVSLPLSHRQPLSSLTDSSDSSPQIHQRRRHPLLLRQGSNHLRLVLCQRRTPRHLPWPPGRSLDHRHRPQYHPSRLRRCRQHRPPLERPYGQMHKSMGFRHGGQKGGV